MRPGRIVMGLVVCALAVGVVAGCGGSGSSPTSGGPSNGRHDAGPVGDIPDTQIYVGYAAPSGGYTLNVPEGWARTDSPNGASFTDGLNSIRVEASPLASAPDVTSVRTGDVASLRASTPTFQLQDVTAVTKPAGATVLVRYLRDGTADPVTGKRVRQAVQRYDFWRNGVQVTVTLASPVGADNVDPWRKVTDSFAWTR